MLEDIATSYSDVLQGSTDQLQTVQRIIEVLKKSGSFVHIDSIIEAVTDELKTNNSFVRSACKTMAHEKHSILIENGHGLNLSYRLLSIQEDVLTEKLEAIFGGSTIGIPEKTKEYYDDFGFVELIKSVSRQMNHEDILVRQFDEDRLWLGRYIDFLEKAREYVAWQKSDQAIAQKKIQDMKRMNKG